MLVQIEQNTPEWLEWRRAGIGCSDVAAICGVDPWRSPLDVYNDKKGLSKPRTSSAMQRGHDYEEEALKAFNRKIDGHPFSPACFVSYKMDYFRASIDGYCRFTRKLCEIKIPNREVLEMARFGQVPIHYMYQVQAELIVTDACMAYFVCYNPDTFEIYIVDVHHDIQIQDRILSYVEKFYTSHLLANVPPPDKSDRKKVESNYSKKWLHRLREIKQQRKELDLEYDEVVDMLLEMEGVDISLETDNYVFQRSERVSVDYKQAAIDAKVDLSKYAKPATVYWTLKEKS